MEIGILLTKSGGIWGPIAYLFGYLMNGIYEVLSFIGIENLGLCIILYTTIILMLMLPTQIKQQKFSRISSAMTPEIQEIQKKYKNKKDQASMLKMQEETKLVYEKYGTSPMGGCLGSFIQIPFLFALWPVIQNIPAYVTKVKDAYNKYGLVTKIKATEGYQKILETFARDNRIVINAKEFKGKDAIVDVLYKLQDATWDKLSSVFPALGDAISRTEEHVKKLNYFPTSSFGVSIAETPASMLRAALTNFSIIAIIIAVLIPVISAVTQWLSIKVSQNMVNNANANTEDNTMARQMNMMTKIMPLTSLIIGFTMPVGLGIYWIASAVVRTLQQIFINRHLNKKTLEELIRESAEKAAKKREKKNKAKPGTMNSMARMYTKKIEEMKTEIAKDEERKGQREIKRETQARNPAREAKPGSLASKANMVKEYNNRNNK